MTVGGIALSCLLAARPGAAQRVGGFVLDRFDPSERGSDWFAAESLDLRGDRRFAVGGVGDYAMKPLVAYDALNTEQLALVSDQLFVHLGAGIVLKDRWRVSLNLPLLLVNSGNDVTTSDGTYSAQRAASVGDLRVGADLRLLGEYGAPFTLAGGAQLYAPTGSRDGFASDGTFRIRPRLMAAGELGSFAYAFDLGVLVRPHMIEFAGTPIGTELGFGAAAGVRLFERALLVGPELRGATGLRDALARGTTPLELIFGAHYSATPDLRVSLGAGPGMTQGLGTPALRALAGVTWMPALDVHRDRDGDGAIDRNDSCVDVAAGTKPDPARPGCPAEDRDRDGVVDFEDVCPDQAGTDQTPSRRGCPPAPPPPKPDRDRDGVSDDVDACPTEAGPADADPKLNGCPRARVDTEAKEIRILQRIEFDYDQATLRGSSDPVLQSVRTILVDHPEIVRVEIQGHSDNQGTPEYNLGLSQRRADAVRLWLISHGISASRLRSAGYGETRTIDTNDTPAGRQNNRRVEFHIELMGNHPAAAGQPATGQPPAAGPNGGNPSQ